LSLTTQVAIFVDEAVKIAQSLKTAYGPKLKDFKDALEKGVSCNLRCCSCDCKKVSIFLRCSCCGKEATQSSILGDVMRVTVKAKLTMRVIVAHRIERPN